MWSPPQRIEELFASTKGNSFQSINQPTAGPRTQTKLQVRTFQITGMIFAILCFHCRCLHTVWLCRLVFFLAMQRGPAPFQLYSLATPNGWKVAILLEELGIDYDAHIVNIGAGEQFGAGFGTFYSILSCHRCFICEHSVLQWVPHRIARSPL